MKMIIQKYHAKSPQYQSLYCLQNGDISLNLHNPKNCINSDQLYSPFRLTLLCVKPSAYAGRYVSISGVNRTQELELLNAVEYFL